jgi:hypothetical protein
MIQMRKRIGGKWLPLRSGVKPVPVRCSNCGAKGVANPKVLVERRRTVDGCSECR